MTACWVLIAAGLILCTGEIAAAPHHAPKPHATPRPHYVNPDQVRPGENATTRPLDLSDTVSSSTERRNRLSAVAVDGNFREDLHTTFTAYHDLSEPGRGRRRHPAAGHFVPTLQSVHGPVGHQPRGVLSGVIMYCSAGHGWTCDNTSTSLWYTQRPDTHGIVEDFGNLDQMNLFADLCFRAGATVVPLRPLGFQHVERVVDNDLPQAEFEGKWADSGSTISFGFSGARVPYRFAVASKKETAVARFRPVIPVSDWYPVYAWARAGADRAVQTYRVMYAGGVCEVDVNHRRTGNGWVYLGQYYFEKGTTGYVEVTNQVRHPGDADGRHVVIADAIRFGNGMGDINRGGGISGFPREEECSRYWAEESLAHGLEPIYDAFDGSDQRTNVGSAPRMSSQMNRETEGGFFDRLFLSFHSNASGTKEAKGRGVLGLFNSHAVMRPTGQIALAKTIAREINAGMTSGGLHLPEPWHVGTKLTDAHINFGEIRRDYLHNEMSATIAEVAYHDNAQDAVLLGLLSIRKGFAEAALRASLRFFDEVGHAKHPMIVPPAAPLLVSVRSILPVGSIELNWKPGTYDRLASPTGTVRYRLYESKDGVSFDGGRDVGPVTRFRVPRVRPGEARFFRVAAVSGAGESEWSGMLGAVVETTGSRVLVVSGDPVAVDDESLSQTVTANLGAPLRSGGSFRRLVPRMMNPGNQVASIGQAVAARGMAFDSVSADRLTADFLAKTKPDALIWLNGRRPIPSSLATSATLAALSDYLTSGGHFLLAGANLAELSNGGDLAGLARWGEFTHKTIGADFGPRTTRTEILKAGDGKGLTTVTLALGDRNLRYFEPRPTESLIPVNGTKPVLAYGTKGGIASLAKMDGKHIQSLVMGFPVEELADPVERVVLVEQVLEAMGLKSAAKTKAEAVEIREKKDSKKSSRNKGSSDAGRKSKAKNGHHK